MNSKPDCNRTSKCFQKKNIKTSKTSDTIWGAPDLWQTGTSCSTLRPNLAFPPPQQTRQKIVVFGEENLWPAMGSKFGHTKMHISCFRMNGLFYFILVYAKSLNDWFSLSLTENNHK